MITAVSRAAPRPVQQLAPPTKIQAKTVAPPDVFEQAAPKVVDQLAAISVHEPGFFERVWLKLVLVFKVVDPYVQARTDVEQVLSTLAACKAIAHVDLEAALRGRLPPEDAHAIAKHARIFAANAIARNSTTRTASPKRPIAVEATPYPQRDITVDGMRLRYIDVGPAKPRGTIILVHGHMSTVEEFTHMIPALSKEYRVVTLDLPGSGYSDHPDTTYNLKLYEQTIVHFMDALKIDKATVAGGSMGGDLSLLLGRDAPERFPSVIAWSPAGVWEPKRTLAWASEKLTQGVFYWPVLRYQSATWQKPGTPGREEGILDSIRYREEVDDPFHALGWYENGVEFRKELGANVELEEFEGAGHSIHFERKDEVLARMLRFLDAQCPR